MEDVEGDQLLKAKTIPIVLGINRARWISLVCLVAIIGISLPFLIEGYVVFKDAFIRVMGPTFVIYGLLLVCCILLLNKPERNRLKQIDLILKITMLIGCCMPFYWYFL